MGRRNRYRYSNPIERAKNDPELIQNLKYVAILAAGIGCGAMMLDIYYKNFEPTLRLDKECVEREISDTRERTNQNIKSIIRKCEK